jgi:hypothetical protein
LPPGPRSTLLHALRYARDPFGWSLRCLATYGDPCSSSASSSAMSSDGRSMAAHVSSSSAGRSPAPRQRALLAGS